MSEGQLKSSIDELDSPALSLIFVCLFGGTRSEIEMNLKKLIFPE